jgi:hypothetical protein
MPITAYRHFKGKVFDFVIGKDYKFMLYIRYSKFKVIWMLYILNDHVEGSATNNLIYRMKPWGTGPSCQYTNS